VLSRNANPLFGVPLQQIQNPPQTIYLRNLTEGTYYWTVTAETGDGREAGAITPFSFRVLPVSLPKITLINPPSGEEIPGLEARMSPTFATWSPPLDENGAPEALQNVRFILSRNSNPAQGENISLITNPGHSITIPPLDAGIYYWIVEGATTDNINVTPNLPSTFTVLPIPLLPMTASMTPAKASIFDTEYFRANRQITFTWTPVAGASHYIFTLLRSGLNAGAAAIAGLQGAIIVNSGPIAAPDYTLTDFRRLDRGNFIWRVEAILQGPNNTIEQHGEVAESNFIIDIPANPSATGLDAGTLYGN
jgi:hypothetical protein